jgi:hypothetical protein
MGVGLSALRRRITAPRGRATITARDSHAASARVMVATMAGSCIAGSVARNKGTCEEFSVNYGVSCVVSIRSLSDLLDQRTGCGLDTRRPRAAFGYSTGAIRGHRKRGDHLVVVAPFGRVTGGPDLCRSSRRCARLPRPACCGRRLLWRSSPGGVPRWGPCGGTHPTP